MIFSDLNYIGKEFPTGDNTFLTVCQGDRKYTLSDRFISEKGKYYMFSADLHHKIREIAREKGAFDYLDE